MKAFLKTVFRQAAAQLLASLMILFLFFVVMMGILGGLAESGHSKGPGPSTILAIDLGMQVTDSPPSLEPADLVMQSLFSEGGKTIHLYKLLETLEAAAEDPDIKGIYLHGNYQPHENSSGFAGLREVRDKLMEFRKKGKPVYASAFHPSLHTYYLMSCASTLYMNPFSDIEINGFGSEFTFFAPALEKLGVGLQPVRVGKYKAAIEPFTRDSFSEEAHEQLQAMLDDRWDIYFNQIAENRGIKGETLAGILKEEYRFEAKAALDAGLVDALATRAEIYKEIAKVGKWDEENATFKQIPLHEYASSLEPVAPPAKKKHKADTIAVVYLEGTIVNGQSLPGYAGAETLHGQLSKLAHQDEVKAIVLRVNSPGGSANAAEIIQQALLDCKDKGKVLVASMGAMAASGGYWVSAPADRILAQPETITGSIGVFGLLPNIQGLGEKLGLSWESISSAQHQDPYAISRPKTEEEIEKVQQYVDRIYDTFIQNVAKHRGIAPDQVDAAAQGRVWTAPRALENRLVDEIGGLQAAITAASDLAGIHTYEIRQFPEDLNDMELLEKFLEENFASARAAAPSPLQLQALEIQRQIQSLQHWNDPRNVYARFPFDIR